VEKRPKVLTPKKPFSHMGSPDFTIKITEESTEEHRNTNVTVPFPRIFLPQHIVLHHHVFTD